MKYSSAPDNPPRAASLSSRRAWIEMLPIPANGVKTMVALLTEGED